MGQIVLNNRFHLPVHPTEAFARFGTGNPSDGWLFGAEVSRASAGGLVRLAIPLGGLTGLDGTARILKSSPCRRIDLVHESPWLGHVACLFAAGDRGGTDLTVRVSIDDHEIERLSAEFGLVGPAPSDGVIPLGLLTSMSGSAGILGRSTVNCAELAVAEINADGGVLGLPVELVVADDATDATVGALAMRRLLDTKGLSAVVGMHSSATYAATAPLAVRSGVPYLYTPASEFGPGQHPLLIRFGETPVDQLHRAVPRLAEETGGRRWFFVGNDYSWPRAIGSTARTIVERIGGHVAGEGYLPVGATQFDSLLDAIERSGTDHVISSFIGQDHVRFAREFARAGLARDTRTFAPLLDDAVVEHLGADAAGSWNVLGYFEGLDTSENRQFLARYRDQFGLCSPPISASAEGVYEAVHTWAMACRHSRGVDAAAVLAGLQAVDFVGPRPRSSSGDLTLLLGEATDEGVRVLDDLPYAQTGS